MRSRIILESAAQTPNNTRSKYSLIAEQRHILNGVTKKLCMLLSSSDTKDLGSAPAERIFEQDLPTFGLKI